MSEPKTSFMTELDQWTNVNVVMPLAVADLHAPNWAEITAQVTKAIRAKVLESYRNGQAAGPRKAFKR